MKASSLSPANIAFIKYWGQKDPTNFIPYNGSISMNLCDCLTHTTVEISTKFETDTIEITDHYEKKTKILNTHGEKDKLLFAHIERIRNLADPKFAKYRAKIQSKNYFPANCGIASSASGFSALTLSLCKVFELNHILHNKEELSRLTRRGGSVSAMRSIFDGFTESYVNKDDCYTKQVADWDHWKLGNVIAVVNDQNKKTSSTQGHLIAETSPFFKPRLSSLHKKLQNCRDAILNKNLTQLGEIIEEDAINMHTVMMTSTPSLLYWTPGTIAVIQKVKQLRRKGIECYFTIDAGPNVHIICEFSDFPRINEELEAMPEVLRTYVNKPCSGAHIINDHLF